MRSLSWLALITGICLLLFLPELPPLSWPLAALACSAMLSWRWPAWRAPVFFFAGCFWAVWRAGLWLDARVPERLEGRPHLVTARVEGLPEAAGHGRCRLRVRPEDTLATLGLSPTRQRWDLNAPCQDYWPGDRWSFRLRLKQPRGTVSDGAFDGEEWLAGEGVTAIGMVREAQLVENGGWSADSWRLQIRHRFAPLIADNPRAGIALALLTGDRDAVSPQDRDIFVRAGISHLMAISGVHVLLFAMALSLLAERALRRRPGVFRTAPWPRLRWGIVLIAATAYGLLSGLSLPTVRTLVMVVLCALITMLKRQATPWDLLVRSAGLVLLADPLAVHETAFWLSFIAVGLLALHAGREALREPWRAFLHAQFYLFLTLTPLTLWSFGQISVVTPLTNTLAIPVISFAVVPLDLAGLALGNLSETAGMACWFWAGSMVDMLVNLLDRLTAWQGVMVHVAPGPRGLVLLALAALSALIPPVIAPRWVALLWLLPLLSPAQAPPPGGLRMAVLDVGQGLAVALETRRHVLLFDTGPTEYTGARTIVPWLRQAGHDHLDRLVISHNDSDHSGGAQAVIDSLPVARGEYSAWPMLYSYPAGYSAGFCRAGDHWQWDGVDFTYLSPGKPVDGLDENNRSCVLRVRGPGWSALLTGDIEEPAEQALIASGADLGANVLILGHHGSKTSSGEAFLRRVGPELAIVSAGYRNRFGHPAPVVLQRLLRLGIPVDSTVERGTLRYDFAPGGGIRTAGARDIRHYWRN